MSTNHRLIDRSKLKEMYFKGNYQQLIDQVDQISEEDRDFDHKYYKLRSLNKLQKFEIAEPYGEKLFEEYKDKSALKKLNILDLILWQDYRRGRYEKGLSRIKKGIEIIDTINLEELSKKEMKDISTIFNHAGIFNYAKDNNMDAIDYYQKVVEIGKSIDDSNLISTAYTNIGAVYQAMGKYDQTIYYQNQALELSPDDKRQARVSYNNLANSYYSQGKLDKAEQAINKSIEIAKELDDNLALSKGYTIKGSIEHKRGNNDHALELLENALKIKRKVRDPHEIAETLYEIFEIYALEKNDRETANDVLRELKELVEKAESTRVEHFYKIAEVIYLKESSLFRHKLKAENKLKQLIKTKNLEFRFKIRGYLSLVELLLIQIDEPEEKEMLTKEEYEEIFSEILDIYETLKAIEISKNSPALSIQLHYIRAYLSLINLDTETAEKELIQAKQISEDSGLEVLNIKKPELDNIFDVKEDSIPQHISQSINRLIHTAPRLKILATLLHNDNLTFTKLRKKVDLTPGNMGRHCDKLAEAGYITKEKKVINDKFQTVYSLTPEGLNDFKSYSVILRSHLAS